MLAQSFSFMVRIACFVGLAAAGLSISTPTARAYEYHTAGARSLGRGGAVSARADDPFVIYYNPSRLPDLRGPQLMINLQMSLFDGCYQRPGNYNSVPIMDGNSPTVFGPVAQWSNTPFPKICNANPLQLGGMALAFTFPILPGELALGIGVFTPAAVGHVKWGRSDGAVISNGEAFPSPNRYALTELNLQYFEPMVSLGWRPAPWISFGASFEFGMLISSLVNYSAQTGGESPAFDVRSKLSTKDLFVPGVVVGTHIHPLPELDISATFRWRDSAAGVGTLTATASPYALPGAAHPSTEVQGAGLFSPLNSSMNFGLRYAHPRPLHERNGRVNDSMETELFDLALDFGYFFNSRVDDFIVTVPTGTQVEVAPNVRTGLVSQDKPNRPECDGRECFVFPHRWRDNFVIRLGSDINLAPGLLTLRLGLSAESNAQDPNYTQLDFFMGPRLGVHLGLTVRYEMIDISVAYAHFLYETTETPLPGGLKQVAISGTPSTVNSGSYSASLNAFSLTANMRF